MDPIVPRLAVAAADVLCPERCAGCDALVDAGRLFCHACLGGVNVLGPPECRCCGIPLAQTELCPPCGSSVEPIIRRARAWAAYDGDVPGPRPVADVLAAFKYRGMHRLGRRMAAVMRTRAHVDSGTIIAPMPLHPRRLRQRGFNQSAVLARHLGRALGRSVALRLLLRTRDTPSQTALSLVARAANVAGAFAVRVPHEVHDRSILLIDDVWTSGATARAAGRVLRANGATAVDVLTFARVP